MNLQFKHFCPIFWDGRYCDIEDHKSAHTHTHTHTHKHTHTHPGPAVGCLGWWCGFGGCVCVCVCVCVHAEAPLVCCGIQGWVIKGAGMWHNKDLVEAT